MTFKNILKTNAYFTMNVESIKMTDYVKMLCQDFNGGNLSKLGNVVEGSIVSIDNKVGFVVIDAGLKGEGIIPIKEFFLPGEKETLEIGKKVKVYISSIDTKEGKYSLSREKAIKEEAWQKICHSYDSGEIVEGIPFAKVKGGICVDFQGLIAFLPGSQIEEGNVHDVSYLMGSKHGFKVISIDRKMKSAIVSRKSVIDDSYREVREKFFEEASEEGMVVEGYIRNITDYSVFVDLGIGVDAILHMADISWDRINHPSEVLSVKDKIKAKIVKIDKENNKISISMKHLTENPWLKYVKDLQIGDKISGKISNIVDYGLFIEVNDKVEGLIKNSEITWLRGNQNEQIKQFNIGDEVETMILEIDSEKQRISLSIKRLLKNPWKEFAETTKEGDIFEAKVMKIMNYGLFVEIGDIDGLIHVDDLMWSSGYYDWKELYKENDQIKVVYLNCDENFTKIKFGLKQLTKNPFITEKEKFAKGKVVTCEIITIKHDRIGVKIVDGVYAIIKKIDLSRERIEQRTDRFTVGDKIDAVIVSSDENKGKLVLSIKDLEEKEYKDTLKKYGSSNSGASIADILGIQIGKNKD